MPDHHQAIVAVNFAKKTGIPLFKRQNTFSISYSFLQDEEPGFRRDEPLIGELGCENMRVDLSMGNNGLGNDLGLPAPDGGMRSSFDFLDGLLGRLFANGTQPYLSYAFTPPALQCPDTPKAFKFPPVSYEGWEALCATIAAHYREKGWPMAAHEVWNEPDILDGETGERVFFQGEWEEYIRLYEHAVRGIRRADPDALVGGLSLAFIDSFPKTDLDAFFRYVIGRGLPLDFISYHNYGLDTLAGRAELASNLLQSYGDAFAATQMHINEYHILDWPWSPDTHQKAAAVRGVLRTLETTLEHPQITSVNWACFRADRPNGPLSLVDLDTGKRTAPFHALAAYNRLPVDRVSLSCPDGVRGFASADKKRAGVLLYTDRGPAQSLMIQLMNLPFPAGELQVTVVDETRGSFVDTGESDEPVCLQRTVFSGGEPLMISQQLPETGFLLIELTAADALPLPPVWSLTTEKAPLAGGAVTVLRREYAFPDRDKNTFAEFDLRTFTAYCGMGDAAVGCGLGGVLLSRLPATLRVEMEVWGILQEQSRQACLFLKLDYRDRNGYPAKSVVYLAGGRDELPAIPWSSGDSYALRPFGAGGVIMVDLEREAPEAFFGNLMITYGIRDFGRDVTAKFRFLPVAAN